jgi:hypothetical protein
MGNTVGATLTKTIECSNCKRVRHVCVADENESKCLSAMNYEVKHGLCGHCEDAGYEQAEIEKKPMWWKHCKLCSKQVHPGAWDSHQRDHSLARKEGMWAGKVRAPQAKQAYRQDW